MGFMDSLSQRKSRKSLRAADLSSISEKEEELGEKPSSSRKDKRKDKDESDRDKEAEQLEEEQRQQRFTRDKRRSVHRRSQSFSQMRWSKVFKRSDKKKLETVPDDRKNEEDETLYDENGLPILRLSLDRLVPKESPWDDADR